MALREPSKTASPAATKVSPGYKVRLGPAGLHLFNRATGSNILIDEIVPPPASWSLAPRHVSVALTNACDLSCPHCYAPKNFAALDLSKLVRWLIELDANGCLGVGFGGGEPTLYPELCELSSFVEQKTNLAIALTTHGHHLDDRLLAKLTGNLHFVRVSMDGIGPTYESIRGRSFDALFERIGMLKRFLVPFGINFLVNSKTIVDLDAAVRIAEDLGAAQFLLLPEQATKGSTGIRREAASYLRKWVSEYRGSVPLAISENCGAGFPVCNPLQGETGLAAFAHIDASGILKETSYDSKGVPIGDDGIMAAHRKLGTIKQEAVR